MKARSLWMMVVAAVAALLAAAWVVGSRAPEAALPQPGPLAPGLAKALDSVTRVRIVGAGDATLATLDRGADGWSVAERSGYRADIEKLRALLQTLATAQRVEARTRVPERYAQLGVEDVSAADARGVRVEVVTPQQTHAWIIGNNPVRGVGTYVRAADQAQSWQIGTNLAVGRSAANWLDRNLVDIGANRVVGIEVAPAQGPGFALARTEDDPASDFAFVTLPKGRRPAEGFRREALAGVLSGLMFDDVFTPEQRAVPEQVQRTIYRLEDGRELEIHSWTQDSHTLATFTQRLDQARADAWRARQAERQVTASSNDAADGADAAAPEVDGAADIDPAQAVDAFQKAHAGWVYQLPGYKASNLDKPLEAYLEPAK